MSRAKKIFKRATLGTRAIGSSALPQYMAEVTLFLKSSMRNFFDEDAELYILIHERSFSRKTLSHLPEFPSNFLLDGPKNPSVSTRKKNVVAESSESESRFRYMLLWRQLLLSP
jgi:hypothetical protein